MKKQPNPTASKFTILRQLCNLIPTHLVPKLARETGVDEKARTYSPWSHIVTMVYAQLTQAQDLCGGLDDHPIDGPVHGLGQASAAQGRSQGPVRLDLQCFLPRCAIIDPAREADSKRAREVCAALEEGEIVIFDKAYVDFGPLGDLQERGVIILRKLKGLPLGFAFYGMAVEQFRAFF